MVYNHGCCGWCGLFAFGPGRLCPQVWCCGRLVPWHAGWQSGSQQFQPAHWRVIGLAISFPSSFPLWRYAQMMRQHSLCLQCSSLIISQRSIRVLMRATRSWESSPGLATISSNSPKCTWVLTSCDIPCWTWSRKVEALALVAFCSSLLLVGIHCACISRDLVPRAAKTYLRWSLLSGRMQLRRSQFSRVWQNMEKEWYASWEFQS